jgi:hypothetical protein
MFASAAGQLLHKFSPAKHLTLPTTSQTISSSLPTFFFSHTSSVLEAAYLSPRGTPANRQIQTTFGNATWPPAKMKSRRHSKHRRPKGKEPAGSNIIDLSESPVKNMPSSNASNDTNMANEATATGANTIPLGTGSEGSSGRAGTPPKTPNPFSPSSVSMGPRPKRVWQPHLPLFSSEDFEEPRTGEKPGANNVCILVLQMCFY